MKLWKLTLEFSIYLLVLVLAAGIRFVALGHAGLSDAEASLALQAYQLAAGKGPVLDPHVIFLIPTSVFIYLFGASNFVVRFWPALAGSVMVLLPAMFKDRLGRSASIGLAVFLALDPGIVAASRQVNSTLITVVLVLFTLAFWRQKRSIAAGILGGLSLLGGPQLWPGLIAMGITALIATRLNLWEKSAADEEETTSGPGREWHWRQAVGVGVVSFVIVGSFLLFVPQGIGTAAGSLAGYLGQWARPSSNSIGILFTELWAYEALGLLLGLIAGFSAIQRHDSTDRILGIWWGLSLILAVINPGRQLFDLIWPIVPMLALSARQLMRMAQLPKEDRLVSMGEAALVVVLLMFMIYTGLSWPKPNGAIPADATWALTKLGVSAVLLLAVAGLIGWGWNARLTIMGMTSGIAIVLAAIFVSGAFHAAGLSRYPENELMQAGPAFVDADLLSVTLHNYSVWKPNPEKQAQITVVGVDSPALQWAMRDYGQSVYVQALLKDSQPDMLITPENMSLAMSSAYRGEGFYLTKTPAWSLMFPSEWMQWLIYRNVPDDSLSFQKIILWVRADDFPGGAGTAPASGSN